MKVVILNDTRDQPHFGCHRVMRTIGRLLQRREASIIGTALTGTRWESNPAFLRALRRCDAVVINGEGTLHHGHARAERLLRVVDHPLCAGKFVSVVNAVYQRNPPAWSRFLAKVQLIVARDGRSHRELAGVYGGRLLRTLDFSLHEPHPVSPGARQGITVGDSAFPQVSRRLLKLAAATEDATFLPIMRTIKSRKAELPVGLRKLRDAYVHLHAIAYRALHRQVRFVRDEFEYLELIGRSRFHLTGRFHGACLSLLAGTPFLAVASNSWKLEALVEDLGLAPHRIVPAESIDRRLDGGPAADFSPPERSSMTAALEDSRRTTERAFDEIVARAA